MEQWNVEDRPALSVCPKHYCFNWVPPKGKANLSGKVYGSFEEAVAEKEMVTFLHGGCAAPFGVCSRGPNHRHDRSDLYEPFESVLRNAGLPDLFFCDPSSLDKEYKLDYEAMAIKLWGSHS